MSFSQGNAIVFDVVPAWADNFSDIGLWAHEVGYHGTPVQVAIAHTSQCAATFFCQFIQFGSKFWVWVPWIEGFFAGCDGIYAMFCANCEDVFQFGNGWSCSDDADIYFVVCKEGISFAGCHDLDSQIWVAMFDYCWYVFADKGRVHVKGTEKFSAFFKAIAH